MLQLHYSFLTIEPGSLLRDVGLESDCVELGIDGVDL